MSSQILETNNYEKFELLPFNRDIRRLKILEESMRKHGWHMAHPMHVVRSNNGKLLIKDGHRRFEVARKLGIPVKYVEAKDDNISVFDINISTEKWNPTDFVVGHARSGKEAYIRVLEYQKDTGITISDCLSMLAGDSAGSHNHDLKVKQGTYKLGDPKHASIVADLVLHCKQFIPWATNCRFVRAISKLAWAKDFDLHVLKRKISTFPYMLQKQANVDGYLSMLDGIFNRQSQIKVPLAFNAAEAAKERNAIKKNY